MKLRVIFFCFASEVRIEKHVSVQHKYSIITACPMTSILSMYIKLKTWSCVMMVDYLHWKQQLHPNILTKYIHLQVLGIQEVQIAEFLKPDYCMLSILINLPVK